jgi:hypothetical protein
MDILTYFRRNGKSFFFIRANINEFQEDFYLQKRNPNIITDYFQLDPLYKEILRYGFNYLNKSNKEKV